MVEPEDDPDEPDVPDVPDELEVPVEEDLVPVVVDTDDPDDPQFLSVTWNCVTVLESYNVSKF